MRVHYSSPTCSYTHLDWVMMGYRVLFDAKPTGYDSEGEALYSSNDVEKDDEDLG